MAKHRGGIRKDERRQNVRYEERKHDTSKAPSLPGLEHSWHAAEASNTSLGLKRSTVMTAGVACSAARTASRADAWLLTGNRIGQRIRNQADAGGPIKLGRSEEPRGQRRNRRDENGKLMTVGAAGGSTARKLHGIRMPQAAWEDAINVLRARRELSGVRGNPWNVAT